VCGNREEGTELLIVRQSWTTLGAVRQPNERTNPPIKMIQHLEKNFCLTKDRTIKKKPPPLRRARASKRGTGIGPSKGPARSTPASSRSGNQKNPPRQCRYRTNRRGHLCHVVTRQAERNGNRPVGSTRESTTVSLRSGTRGEIIPYCA